MCACVRTFLDQPYPPYQKFQFSKFRNKQRKYLKITRSTTQFTQYNMQLLLNVLIKKTTTKRLSPKPPSNLVNKPISFYQLKIQLNYDINWQWNNVILRMKYLESNWYILDLTSNSLVKSNLKCGPKPQQFTRLQINMVYINFFRGTG